MTSADVILAAVVGTLALVPAAILLIAGFALLGTERLAALRRRAAFRPLVVLAAFAAGVGFVRLTWQFAGATHLKPLCLGRAEPILYATEPSEPSALAVRSDRRDPSWLPELRRDGFFARIVVATENDLDAVDSPRYELRVQRRVLESTYWSRITADRFELVDRDAEARLAVGEEFWIDAGGARYRCGIASGPLPVASRGEPGGAGVARFLRAAMAGTSR